MGLKFLKNLRYNRQENRRFFHGTQRFSTIGIFGSREWGFFWGVKGIWYLLHMTKFYDKKVKDLMALIRQILNLKKKKKNRQDFYSMFQQVAKMKKKDS